MKNPKSLSPHREILSAVLSSMGFYLRLLCSEALELIRPRVCASCGAYGTKAVNRSLCSHCDFQVRHSLLNVHCSRVDGVGCPIYSAGAYEHELARSILAYKNHSRTDLLDILATGLVRVVVECLQQAEDVKRIVLIPMPSDPSATRRRGYVPAQLLAERVCQLMGEYAGVSCVSYGLLSKKKRWGRGDKSGQKLLTGAQRRQRLSHSMRLASPPLSFMGFYYDVRGVHCLLVDDVLTTGATLAEGYRVVSSAGGKVIGAVTVAYVPYRGGTSTYTVGYSPISLD